MKIGIVVDNPRRDLDGLLLVAHHLVRRGHTAFVVPMYQQGYDVPWLELDAIIVNYARPTNRDFLAACHALGTAVAVLDTEGGVVPDDGAKTPYGPDSIRTNDLAPFIDRYLFWGERQYEYFRKRSPIPVERLHVTGCPRYDFCHPRWQPALAYPLSDYILINTNFSSVNPLFTGSAEKELAQMLSVGWGAEETHAHLVETAATFRSYLDTLQTLIESNPQQHFVLRPHPFEGWAIYQRRFGTMPNVRIDGEGSVMTVIRNATCTVHLNCQTAIETLLMGKLPLSIEYLNTDRARQRYALPSAVSWPAATFDQLNAIIQAPHRYFEQMPASTLFQQYVRPLFHDNDGQAAWRIADIVERMARRTARAPERLAPSLRGSFATATVARLAQGALCNTIGSRSVAALRARVSRPRRFKQIMCSDVRGRLAAIAAADGFHGGTTICHAPHPATRAPLATIVIRPTDVHRPISHPTTTPRHEDLSCM